MGVLRKRISQALCDEDLPMRVRQLLIRADDMRDLHIEVVNHAGVVVEYSAVSTLDHMVLLTRPLYDHIATNVIVEPARAFTCHLEADRPFAALALELRPLRRRIGQPS